MSIELRDYQLDAINRMSNGCILNGGVGSGKSITSLAYYYMLCGGQLSKEKYILSINKLNTNFNTEVKSKIEMLLNESDTNYYRLDEYIKDVLKCSNGAYRTNKKKLINTYDLLRSFAHAYKANYKLEECRNLFNLSSKEYEIEFGLTISNFYLNYIYDEENLNKYFNYALLNLEDVKPTIIDYEYLK